MDGFNQVSMNSGDRAIGERLLRMGVDFPIQSDRSFHRRSLLLTRFRLDRKKNVLRQV